LFTLIKGGFRTITGLIAKLRPDNYKVQTSYAIVGVRGTTVEAVIQGGAFYVGVWQGTVSVNTNKDEILLGFGQDFNFARVTSINSAPKGLVETPPQFQLNVDPDLQERVVDPTQNRLVASVQMPIAGIAIADLRFAPGELASLDRVGIAVFDDGPGGLGPFIGQASDGASGSPIIFDIVGDEVLRQDTAPLAGAVVPDITLGAAFPVSWGAWNASPANPGLIQTDPNDGAVGTAVTDTVFWITAVPTPATSLPTGTFTYSNVLGFQGAGEAGAVNALAMNMSGTLNFGTGAITGDMQVANGPRLPSGFNDQWDANFSGSFTAGQLDATVTGGTVSVDGTVQLGSPTGTLNGVMTGPNGEGIGGGFDLQHGATNYVTGTFFVTQ
jgi:hypothetical protein